MRMQALVLILVAVLASTACSLFEPNRIEYQSAGKLPSLEVPPDLTRPGRDERYVVPDVGTPGSATLSAYTADRATAPKPGTTEVLPTSERMRIERAGQERWLVVNEKPEKLWPIVREFWQQNGFLLRVDSPETGVLETDWAENRAKIPNDGIRSVLGRVLDTAYSTGERDKFRTRLERVVDGFATEIYISHRGMVEVIVNNAQGMDNTRWQPREPDPGLEAEFLRRLMVRLGADEEREKIRVADAPPSAPERAKLTSAEGGTGLLVLEEPFDRAWRRVGLALDRVGFTVEDRDRSRGMYFVRYIDPREDQPIQKPGLLSRIFGTWDRGPGTPEQYRVLVKGGVADKSEIQVLGKDGGTVTSGAAKRILGLLHSQLK